MGRNPTVTPKKLERVFTERGGENPFLTTGDVGDELGVSTETARKHLNNSDEYVSYDAGRGQIWLRDSDCVLTRTGDPLIGKIPDAVTEDTGSVATGPAGGAESSANIMGVFTTLAWGLTWLVIVSVIMLAVMNANLAQLAIGGLSVVVGVGLSFLYQRQWRPSIGSA